MISVAAALLQLSVTSDAAPRTRSPTVLAQAVAKFTGKPTRANDVRNVECEGLFYDFDHPAYPMPYACKWQQRFGSGWRSYTSYFDFNHQRWALTHKPATDQPADPSSAEERGLRDWLIPRLRTAALKYLEDPKKLTIRYGYAFVDLNDDGRNEAIVWLASDNDCGTGGCSMEVEVQRSGGWQNLSYTVRTRPPIKILPTKHHEWHDIGVVDGRGGMPRTFESPPSMGESMTAVLRISRSRTAPGGGLF